MVQVYRNLNRKGVVWSVKSKRTGRVLSRSTYVVLRDVTFKVSEKGRRRALKSGKRNVHAFVEGTSIRGDFNKHCYDSRGQTLYDFESGGEWKAYRWERIYYDPFKDSSFVLEGSKRVPVKSAEYAILDETGLWAFKPE